MEMRKDICYEHLCSMIDLSMGVFRSDFMGGFGVQPLK